MERESPSAAKQGDKPMELPIKAWLEERGGSKITDHPLEGKKIGEENGGRPFFVQDYFPEENRFTHSFSPLSLSLHLLHSPATLQTRRRKIAFRIFGLYSRGRVWLIQTSKLVRSRNQYRKIFIIFPIPVSQPRVAKWPCRGGAVNPISRIN